MKLILIRHTSTDYNLDRRYCGFSDIGINKKGIIQAKRIKNKLGDFRVDKIFCSDLKRTFQTAKIIFAKSACRIIKRKNLREINFGEWEGLKFEQIIEKHPLRCKKWFKNSFGATPPKGERLEHFISRIEKELKRIIDSFYDKTVVIIGHYGVMRVILNNALGMRKKDFWMKKFNSRAVYIIDYNNKLNPRIRKL